VKTGAFSYFMVAHANSGKKVSGVWMSSRTTHSTVRHSRDYFPKRHPSSCTGRVTLQIPIIRISSSRLSWIHAQLFSRRDPRVFGMVPAVGAWPLTVRSLESAPDIYSLAPEGTHVKNTSEDI
jgi:hypothetical protein